LDPAQIFTWFFKGRFPCCSYWITTWWRGDLVGHAWVTSQKGYNFWSDRWIALKFLHDFSEVVFLGYLLNHYLRRGGLVSHAWVTGQKGYNFWSYCWIALKCLLDFSEAVFLGVSMKSLLSDEEVWSVKLE
jgi:hypothetical protein